MTVKSQIETRLQVAFAPRMMVVSNESHLHAGHAGDDGSGESHFRVAIRSAAFAGLGRVARHRAVYQALGELTMTVHALTLDIDT